MERSFEGFFQRGWIHSRGWPSWGELTRSVESAAPRVDVIDRDDAVVTLMSYPDLPLLGRVDSVGWGIAQQDGSTGQDLLPNISPTFEWIRLAQRVPVRIHLEAVPDGVELRVGTTASVMVRTGTAGDEAGAPASAAPSALQ
jgi:multidrug resistance efflux pump